LYDRELKIYPPLLVQIDNRVRRLCRAVVRADRYFWPGLLDPAGHLLVKSISIRVSNVGEILKVFQESRNAWMETRGNVSVEDGLRLSCVSGRKEEGRASGC
jgi:hypothetical protein